MARKTKLVMVYADPEKMEALGDKVSKELSAGDKISYRNPRYFKPSQMETCDTVVVASGCANETEIRAAYKAVKGVKVAGKPKKEE